MHDFAKGNEEIFNQIICLSNHKYLFIINTAFIISSNIKYKICTYYNVRGEIMFSSHNQLGQELTNLTALLKDVQEKVEKLDVIKFACEKAIFNFVLELVPSSKQDDAKAIVANFKRVSASLNPSDANFDSDLSKLIESTMVSLNKILPNDEVKKSLLEEKFNEYVKIVKYYWLIKSQTESSCNESRKFSDDCITYVESVGKIIKPIYSILNPGLPELNSIDDYRRSENNTSYSDVIENVANRLSVEHFRRANDAVGKLAMPDFLKKNIFNNIDIFLNNASRINLSIIDPNLAVDLLVLNKDLILQFSVVLPTAVSSFASGVKNVVFEIDVVKEHLVESEANYKKNIQKDLNEQLDKKVGDKIKSLVCELRNNAQRKANVHESIGKQFDAEISDRLRTLNIESLLNMSAVDVVANSVIIETLERYKKLSEVIRECDDYNKRLIKNNPKLVGSVSANPLPSEVDGFNVTDKHKWWVNSQIKKSILNAENSSVALETLSRDLNNGQVKYVLTANRDGFGTRLLKSILFALSWGKTAKRPGLWKSHGAVHAEKLESIVSPAKGHSRS